MNNSCLFKGEMQFILHSTGVAVRAKSCARLRQLPRRQALDLLGMKNHFPQFSIRRIIVVPAQALDGIDFTTLPEEVIRKCLVDNWIFPGCTLDTRKIPRQLAIWQKDQERREEDVASPTVLRITQLPVQAGAEDTNPAICMPKASVWLGDDLRFNWQQHEYPTTPGEYHAMMQAVLDDRGIFPGDTEALTRDGFFAPAGHGVRHLILPRRGKKFTYEVVSPRLHAGGVQNRLVFDADLLSQIASFDSYGTRGVCYDRTLYYDGRLFNADWVPFVRLDGMPVSFAALQGFEASLGEQSLYYAFLHFVMTRGQYQRYGITSFSIRDVISSMFLQDILQNKPNLVMDSDGNIDQTRWSMWAFAHSGRLTTFRTFVQAFGSVPEGWGAIPQAIVEDVHRRITPKAEIAARGMPQFLGIKPANGNGTFPVARDLYVYSPETRYKIDGGEVVLADGEKGFADGIKNAWFNAIGGVDGVREGNSLYFGGLVNPWRILDAIRRERSRDGRGVAGAIAGVAETGRSAIVQRMR